NRYYLSRSFLAWPIRKALAPLLPAMRYFPLFLLLFSQSQLNAQRAALFEKQEARLREEYESLCTRNIKNTLYFKIRDRNRISKSRDIVGKRTLQKRKSVMIAQYLRENQVLLPLTMAGKARLSAFPDEALRYAFAQIPKSKATTNDQLFGFVFTCACNWMRDHQQEPDWSISMALCKEYNIPRDARTTEFWDKPPLI